MDRVSYSKFIELLGATHSSTEAMKEDPYSHAIRTGKVGEVFTGKKMQGEQPLMQEERKEPSTLSKVLP